MTRVRSLWSRVGGLSGKHIRSVVWISLGVAIGVLVFAAQRPAHALPEYAARTGQQCTTCHVNPAGGGPRTLRGLLWLAAGRPDEVPPLPGAAEAEPGEEALNGATLYQDFSCAGCHGPGGEGGVGPALNQRELPADKIVEVTRNGQGIMTGYRPDVVSDAQLEAIVEFVQALGRGEVQPDRILEKRPLPPMQMICDAGRDPLRPLIMGCGGN
jgi:mono/diheme cytochrome c family protein